MNEGLRIFFLDIIPESKSNECGPCGMARTLDPVTNSDSLHCQAKKQVMGLEPNLATFKRPRVEKTGNKDLDQCFGSYKAEAKQKQVQDSGSIMASS